MTDRLTPHRGRRIALAGAVCAVAVVAAAAIAAPARPPSDDAPTTLVPVVLDTVPTSPVFVEGLALIDDGRQVLESAGAPSGTEPSRIRILDARTGAVLRERVLPGVFAEGVTEVIAARSGPVFWLATWRDGVVIRLDQDLTERDRRPLTGAGEGWGLCTAGDHVISSDGTDRLTIRDAATFAPVGAITVTAGGRPLSGLNELDCADGAVWANVFPTDELARIDQASGRVIAIVDLSALHEREHPDRSDPDSVFNGVALAPDGTLWLGGKEFPRLLHVRLVPAPASSPASTVAVRTPCLACCPAPLTAAHRGGSL